VTPAPRRRRTQAERSEEAERRILEAAVSIIAERGLEDLTLNEAGTVAGFSKGLPIHYFGTKNILIVSVAKFVIRLYGADLQKNITDKQGLARLESFISNYLTYPVDNPRITRAYYSVRYSSLNRPEIASLVKRLNAWAVGELSSIIVECLPDFDGDAGAFARMQAQLTYSTILGVVGQWLVDADSVDLDRAKAQIFANIRTVLAEAGTGRTRRRSQPG
jgi:AcrR family transcriptional regulator